MQDSLSVVVMERDGDDERVTLEVERLGGAIGEVTVQWEVTGDHSNQEVTPTSGEVVIMNTCIITVLLLFLLHE